MKKKAKRIIVHRRAKSLRLSRWLAAFSIAISLGTGCDVPDQKIDKVEVNSQNKVAGEKIADDPKVVKSTSTDFDDSKELMQELFIVMDLPGPTSEADLQSSLAQLLERETALDTVIGVYNESFEEQFGRVNRWKSVYIATEFYTAESVQFLLSVAFSKDPEVEPIDIEPSSTDAGIAIDSLHQSDLPIRFTAVGGIVSAYIRKVPSAKEALLKILSSAEVPLAKSAALDLFAEGKLNAEFKGVLDRREIPYKFRKLSEKETEELFYIAPEDLEKRKSDQVIDKVEPDHSITVK